MESFHSSLRGRVKVAHPNLFVFLGHLQRATVDSQSDVARGMSIRRAKKRANVVNDKRIKTCIARFDNHHAHTRMQFLQAVSHSIGAHTDSLCPQLDTDTDTDDADEMEDMSAAAAAAAPTAVDDNSAAAGSPAAATPAVVVDSCAVCLIAPKDPHIAQVPCGHCRFCRGCADQILDQGLWCPLCRTPITQLLRLF